jgi:tRNA (guanine37-N1)-methyltransferase
MRIDVVSIFPQMFRALTESGITQRAIEQGVLRLQIWNPRDYASDSYRRVDDRPYGGGPGMVMMPEPIDVAIRAAKAAHSEAVPVVFLTPQGRRLDHSGVTELVSCRGLVLIAGRYEGIDERVLRRHVDEEWSIGDYVLSGGELAAMVIIDAMARQLPGGLGNADSAEQDSFANGLLDYEHYTRPELYDGQAVPAVLLSGDHDAIRRWRLKQSLGRTWLRRPDLLQTMKLDAEQANLLKAFQDEYTAPEITAGSKIRETVR